MGENAVAAISLVFFFFFKFMLHMFFRSRSRKEMWTEILCLGFSHEYERVTETVYKLTATLLKYLLFSFDYLCQPSRMQLHLIAGKVYTGFLYSLSQCDLLGFCSANIHSPCQAPHPPAVTRMGAWLGDQPGPVAWGQRRWCLGSEARPSED